MPPPRDTSAERDAVGRAPLDRGRILAAAVGLADAEGLPALSMRRLGASLGVEAMSLYHHVRNKDDLLGGMLDVVASEFHLATDDVPWREAVRRQATSAHEALMRHPWSVPLWLTHRGAVGATRIRSMDRMLAALDRAGLDDVLLDRAYHAVQNHVIGFTMQAVSFLGSFDEGSDLPALAASFLADLDEAQAPHLAAHVRYHLRADADDEGADFAFGLDLVLDGVERLRRP